MKPENKRANWSQRSLLSRKRKGIKRETGSEVGGATEEKGISTRAEKDRGVKPLRLKEVDMGGDKETPPPGIEKRDLAAN